MKKFSRCLFFLVAAVLHSLSLGNNAFGQQNELLSSVRASTVFSGNAEALPQTGSHSETNRITSADELVRTLIAAGFAASEEGKRAAKIVKQVESHKQRQSHQFPILITISDDQQDLIVCLELRSMSDSQNLSTSFLLSLLESNQTMSRARFVFNRERGQLELLSLIRNSSQTALSLSDEINRMAILARDTESLWNPEIASENAPSILPGRWSASRSATDAFALQLNSDGTFILISVTSGRHARSAGKFRLQDQQLSLEAGDGVRITGTVRILSDSEFQFTQQSSDTSVLPLSFRKAR